MREEDMTTFEKAGFNYSDVFIRRSTGHAYVIHVDDGSDMPLFRDVHLGGLINLHLNELHRIYPVGDTQ